jgi:exopolysaccharide biosynthesis predicted pyruvyltransferase EpsI
MPSPLLDPEYFAPLLEPFAERTVGYVRMHGNAGDRMIDLATQQLFEHFGVRWFDVDREGLADGNFSPGIEELVIAGGGNMGTTYERPLTIRRQALTHGLDVTVFPQSFTDGNEDLSGYKRVYVRERASLDLSPRCSLAPDMALGLRLDRAAASPDLETGVFLRQDREACFPYHPLSLGDPAELCLTVNDYFELAERFETVFTDRLHFAIASLLLGRRTVLLPNNYAKNRSMYDTWLGSLGCLWHDEAQGIDYDQASVEATLGMRLAGSPDCIVPWHYRLQRSGGYLFEDDDGIAVLRNGGGHTVARCNTAVREIFDRCDGNTVEQVLDALESAGFASRAVLGRDVQFSVRQLFELGAIGFEVPPENDPASLSIMRLRGNKDPIEVHVREPRVEGGRERSEAILFTPDDVAAELYFEHDARPRGASVYRGDAFVLAVLHHAMRHQRPLWVRGAPVSRSLLVNLDRFQDVFQSWRRDLKKVDILCEEIDRRDEAGPDAIAGFSGGIDSCYTVYKHLVAPEQRRLPRLRAALMVHGFDIPVEDDEAFERAFSRSRLILEDVDIELGSLKTNIRKVNTDWSSCSHGLALAAALTVFRGSFGGGIIASSVPYNCLVPWGTNPVSDWMMGADDFSIIHDGAEYSRLEKIRRIVDWPAAGDNTRFCWQHPSYHENCGTCRKCLITALMFYSLGRTPTCFDSPPDPLQCVEQLNSEALLKLEWYDLDQILTEARQGRVDQAWVGRLEEMVSTKTGRTR